jgi:hypothetical protein
MRTNTHFHRWSNTERLMHMGEVMDMKQRKSVNMVLDFLAERVGQASEAAHLHPHVEILSLNKAGTNMLRIGVTDYDLKLIHYQILGAS